MKYLSILGAIAFGAMMMIVTHAIAGEGKKMGGTEGTVTGRIVDPACYIQMNLKGDAHRECAQKCAKAGQAFGILDETNGILYQVLEASPMADPNALLMDHAEEVVTVQGMIFEKDGMKAIVPKEVTKGS
jgi:hypothetical protein